MKYWNRKEVIKGILKKQWIKAKQIIRVLKSLSLPVQGNYNGTMNKGSFQKIKQRYWKFSRRLLTAKKRAEVYNKHGAKSIDGRSQLSYKLDLAQRCQPSKIAQSSLHHHRSSALQKDNDTTIMIKVGWELSVSKVNNMETTWRKPISMLQSWCTNLWNINLHQK